MSHGGGGCLCTHLFLGYRVLQQTQVYQPIAPTEALEIPQFPHPIRRQHQRRQVR